MESGILVDPDNIKAIMDWTTSKNVIDMSYFMGLASDYRIFIKKFSRVAYPITSLQKKDTKFVWTSKWEEIYQRMKQLLSATPILKISSPYGEFALCTNACKEEVGFYLLYDDHVISYESQELKDHERNYATHDLELTAIIHALKLWRNYLLGKIFLLKTDNIGLKYLFS